MSSLRLTSARLKGPCDVRPRRLAFVVWLRSVAHGLQAAVAEEEPRCTLDSAMRYPHVRTPARFSRHTIFSEVRVTGTPPHHWEKSKVAAKSTSFRTLRHARSNLPSPFRPPIATSHFETSRINRRKRSHIHHGGSRYPNVSLPDGERGEQRRRIYFFLLREKGTHGITRGGGKENQPTHIGGDIDGGR